MAGFWMNETTGVLHPAVRALFNGEPLTGEQVAALRAYFRQWVFDEAWLPSAELDALRAGVDGLDSRAAIDKWLEDATDLGIDPL